MLGVVNNELDATESALALLSSMAGIEFRLDEERPDEIERVGEAVDFLARNRDQIIAIEHTLIGAFDKQEVLSVQMTQRLNPMCDELEQLLPADWEYQLSISAHEAPTIKQRDITQLKAWIVDAAPKLAAPPNHFVHSPDDVLACTLYRFAPSGRSHRIDLRIGVIPGDALESLRFARLGRAALKKLPKLEAARSVHAATATLLVLESPDVQISSAHAIIAALPAAVGDLSLPDYVVLVEDSHVWLLRAENEWIADPRPQQR